MNAVRHLLTLVPLSLSLALGVAASALAQTVYKSSDGKTYSDTPPAKGEAKPLDIDSNRNVVAPETSPQLQHKTQQLQQQWRDDRARDEEQARSRAERLEEAEAQLQAAEDALAEGERVQAGDFLGRKDGGTRPSLQRIERIESLQNAVDKAKENLETEKYRRD